MTNLAQSCNISEMVNDIASLEKNKNWRTTAEYGDSHKLVGIMAGQRGGEFAGKFYLYDVDWVPVHPIVGGMSAFSAQEIAELFSSGQLVFVRGEIPKP